MALGAVRKNPQAVFVPAAIIDKKRQRVERSLSPASVIDGDQEILDCLLNKTLPLIGKVEWDRNFALQAVRKTPTLYLHLPAWLTKNDKELASSVHKLLVDGDKLMLDLLLSGTPPLINKVFMDLDVALQAVRKTPMLYFHLPPSLTNNKKELASIIHKNY